MITDTVIGDFAVGFRPEGLVEEVETRRGDSPVVGGCWRCSVRRVTARRLPGDGGGSFIDFAAAGGAATDRVEASVVGIEGYQRRL